MNGGLATPPGMLIELLDASLHDRASFSCGVEALDRFLQTQASQDQKKRLRTTHVLVENSPRAELRPVVGFVSLANSQIPLLDAPDSIKRLTRLPQIPAVLLARMAVDRNHKGKKLGEFLLKYALKCSLDSSRLTACAAVIVDAKDDQVKAFYIRYGFQPMDDRPLRLVLPMATIAKAFA